MWAGVWVCANSLMFTHCYFWPALSYFLADIVFLLADLVEFFGRPCCIFVDFLSGWFFFCLETVNFELFTFDKSAVHQQSADVLSLVTLQGDIEKSDVDMSLSSYLELDDLAVL